MVIHSLRWAFGCRRKACELCKARGGSLDRPVAVGVSFKTRKGMGKVRVNWSFGRRNADHILQSKQGVVEGLIVGQLKGIPCHQCHHWRFWVTWIAGFRPTWKACWFRSQLFWLAAWVSGKGASFRWCLKGVDHMKQRSWKWILDEILIWTEINWWLFFTAKHWKDAWNLADYGIR